MTRTRGRTSGGSTRPDQASEFPLTLRPPREAEATAGQEAPPGGRTTPKGAARPDEGAPAGAASGRYTPPIPQSVKVSPPWVPVLMFIFLGIGTLVILINYTGAVGHEQRVPAGRARRHPRRHRHRHPVPLTALAMSGEDAAARSRLRELQRCDTPQRCPQAVGSLVVGPTRSMSSWQWRGGSGTWSLAAVIRSSVPQIEHR